MTTNPALAELQFLAGAWDMDLSEASFLPDPDAKVHGPVNFEWIEQSGALVMSMGDAATLTATWIIGGDDSEPNYCVLYADDRGVSRVYRMSFGDGTWRMWRDTPEFSQRFDAEVTADQAEINGRWQKSADAAGPGSTTSRSVIAALARGDFAAAGPAGLHRAGGEERPVLGHYAVATRV